MRIRRATPRRPLPSRSREEVNSVRKAVVHNDPLDLKNQSRANRPIIVIIVSS
ncbi:hypothetical protein RKD27_009042 [Streptomyces sp. SAI-126]|nr:hypothetical protein [Streptomyces sp. SAI-119]MDH6502228.1 hypothetical protein [Streptomyces sp. SAI-149]